MSSLAKMSMRRIIKRGSSPASIASSTSNSTLAPTSTLRLRTTPGARVVGDRGFDAADPRPSDLEDGAAARTRVDTRTVAVNVPPAQAFAPVRRIGGTTGWYFGDVLWRTRGWLDLALGGHGMRRGRRHPDECAVGDVVGGLMLAHTATHEGIVAAAILQWRQALRMSL